jgi:hypothetical protein
MGDPHISPERFLENIRGENTPLEDGVICL